MIKLLSFLLITCSLFSCSSNPQQKENAVMENSTIAETISVLEFKKKTEEVGGIILDVRTAKEVASGKIKGAIHIDYLGNFEEGVKKLDKSMPVYVYCAVGGRSSKAMNKLQKAGFKTIYNLDGGITAWIERGLAISK